MLEELSLQNNKGSKMFKTRQVRVEKFIYENNPDIFNAQSMDNLQQFIPGLGGQMQVGHGMVEGRGRQTITTTTVGYYGSGGKQLHPPVPPPKPGDKSRTDAAGGGSGQHSGAGGVGGTVTSDASVSAGGKAGEGGDAKAGGKTTVLLVKTYTSPWERAMGNNLELQATMRTSMSPPSPRPELRKYKCFNRTALPFGGFEKASKLMTFQMPDFDAAPPEPEPVVVYNNDINSRPSFNRTPIGWIGSGEPGSLNINLSVPFDGETEEL